MITKTTMNMCGTLGPYGIAVTSSRPSFLRQLPGEVGVVEVAERQGDAERRQDAAEHDVGGQLDHAEAQPGQHDHVEHDVGEQAEEPFQSPGTHQRICAMHCGICSCAVAPSPSSPSRP